MIGRLNMVSMWFINDRKANKASMWFINDRNKASMWFMNDKIIDLAQVEMSRQLQGTMKE